MVALVVIDLQRWMFRTPERLAQAEGLLRNVSVLAARFMQARLPIYDVVTMHKADRSTWSRLMIKHDYECLIEGTPDADPIIGYSAATSAIRVVKTQNSAFIKTAFEERLHADGVSKLMLAGVFMDGCVGLTAADAAQLGFEVVCISDAIGHVDQSMRISVEEWLSRMFEIEQVRTCNALNQIQAGLPSSPSARRT